ncbi:thioredoxin reductase (NADPH) [Salsuginibacillus halophilus]|uniref:Ferredoxin--NADP reductase n=1 Tax=Salsuginibacillus halophilus TaxID=517424 RepID=A0A2P8HE17_9BACI|nr:NAD(P)/FAD-dependent oxidoreductase [Salsuginibacillus halophilus]PSL44464.1 thioredoxin reductase (NADPH) [Salsuginibacillus halophilus]
MSNEQVTDITIIGGGPTGLFTAFYGGMRQASVKIIESMPQLGGQLAALYPEKYIYDVAGFPKVKAQELVDQLVEQMEPFEPEVALEQTVQDVERLEDETFKITTNQEVHYTRTIIITAGVGAFQPKRLSLEGADAYEEGNLHYFIKDLEQFHGKNVLICGGGDSAVDWANMLKDHADVTVMHRRDKFRAHEHSVEEMRNSNINILTPYEINDLKGSGNTIEQVIIKESKGEATKAVDVDELIVNYGFMTSLGPIKEWGLDIERNSIQVNTRMETNIPGIYAAGDVTTYDGKVKLIATGFGEGPTAVNNAKAYIDPDAKVQPGHSSHMF